MYELFQYGILFPCILAMLLVFLLNVLRLICPDSEEDSIPEERRNIEAEVRKHVDVKMGCNKQQNSSGVLSQSTQDIQRQIYWIWFEDETVLSSTAAIAVASMTEL